MRIVLVRHAESVPRGTVPRDGARPLTPRGRRRFALAARALRRAGFRFDVVLHSPRLRATETADLLARCAVGPFRVTPHLARRPSEALLAEIRGTCVALVGHEPWLSELAALLVTGDADAAPKFALGKGGVLVLDGPPVRGAARVEAALPPAVLRRLASG